MEKQVRVLGWWTTRPIIRFLLLILCSWPAMTFTHEIGHVVCGYLGGGELQSLDLLPWHLPHSIFDPDPRPLLTLWGGPIMGVAFPLLLAWWLRSEAMWFIANFCVLANGAYLAVGWTSSGSYLDTVRLLDLGAHPLVIGVYCVLTIGFGYPAFRGSCIRALSSASQA